MPLPNGVDPTGAIETTCPSATWMGNRGEIHNQRGDIVRQFKTKSWVTCRLSYKGWTRKPLMQPGRYTELFFLDEATALSAGHRPCAMCRNAEYVSFKTHWLSANAFPSSTAVADIDRAMHAERMSRSKSEAWQQPLGSLPSGIVILSNDAPYLWIAERLFPWTSNGYGQSVEPGCGAATVQLLTPPSVVNAIRSGYRVQVHSSADVSMPHSFV
jgi:hypothetical protein